MQAFRDAHSHQVMIGRVIVKAAVTSATPVISREMRPVRIRQLTNFADVRTTSKKAEASKALAAGSCSFPVHRLL